MASTYTTNLGIEKIATGEQSGTWGSTTNTNLDLIDQAVNGIVQITVAATGSTGSPNALTITNGSASDGRNKFIDFYSPTDLGGTVYYQLDPNDAEKIAFVRNSLGGGQTLVLFQGTYNASNDVEVPNGVDMLVKFDGTGASATVTNVFEKLQVNALSVNDGNITNVGDIALDSISADGTQIDIDITDNTASAFTISEGANNYIEITTTDGSELITVSKNSTFAGTTIADLGVVTTVDINGGTADNVTIGGGTAAAGTFTTATATTGNITTVNATTVDTTNIEVTNVKAKDGTASATIADSTGVMTIASSVLTTTDINGGTIDGVTIGGASAGAITGTTITGTSFVTSGNMTFGDSDKAIFGAGNDLQIYHDGSNSYIDESAGVGNLIIKGANVQFQTPTSEIYLAFANNGAVTAYYDNAAKLATTATGIDVTGTVTADGLTVDGDATITRTQGAIGNNHIELISADNTSRKWGLRFGSGGNGNLSFDRSFGDWYSALEIDRGTGDISFYEDTGTTPKLFWDASAESLGIGTSSPLSALDVSNSFITVSKGAATTGRIGASDYIVGGTDNDFVVQSSGTGVTRFVQTSTEAMRITSAGNVGIGTTSPSTGVEIAGAFSGSGGLAITQNNGNGNGGRGPSVDFKISQSEDGSVLVTGGRIATLKDDGSDASGAASMVFYTSDSTPTLTERVRIDSSGNVGIGTTSPDASMGPGLHIKSVSGNSLILEKDTGAAIQFRSDASTIRATIGGINGADGLYVGTGAAQTERLRIDSSGNVGIGKTPTDKQLEIYAGGTPAIRIQNSTTGTGSSDGLLLEMSGSNINFFNYETGAMLFGTSNTERMRIDSNGNLLVGSTTSSLTSGDGFVFTPDANVAGAKTGYATDTQTCWNMYSSGAAAYRFYVGWGGTVFATNTTISAISDQRLKENIQDLDAGLDKIMALKPRQFDWKEGKGKNVKGDRGFIAQEFEQVFPDLIDEWKDPAPEGEDPYKSVRADLIPVLVKAIQEQQAIIDSLKSRLDAAGL
jgi:hypothetical protein